MRLVVEADGGSRGNPGPAGYGTLVRDADSGAVLAETGEAIGTTTNNVAEYRGLIAGLQLAADVSAHAGSPDPEVEVRMDSKLVVEQMAGRWKIKHADLKPLALAASKILPGGVARWTWVPREQNRRADQLANAALDGRLEEVVEHPPPRLAAGSAPAADRSAPVGEPEPEPAPPAPAGPGDPVPADPVPADPVPADPASAHPAADPAPGRDGPEPARAPRGDPRRRDSGATVLLLLRHGRTAADAERRFAGPRGEGSALDAAGRHQAAVVAAALADAGIDAVLSSPMRAARETAAVVAGALGLGVVVEAGLADFDPGRWDGATGEEVRASAPAWYAAWSVSPDVAPPDGESVRVVRARVGEAVDRLVRRFAGRRVLLVTHAVPIGCLVTTALEAPLSSAMRLSVGHGTLTVVRHALDGPPRTEGVALPPGTVLPR